MQVVFNSIYCFSDFDGTFLIIKYLPPFCDVKPYILCLQKNVKFFFYPEILIDIYLQRSLDWFSVWHRMGSVLLSSRWTTPGVLILIKVWDLEAHVQNGNPWRPWYIVSSGTMPGKEYLSSKTLSECMTAWQVHLTSIKMLLKASHGWHK